MYTTENTGVKNGGTNSIIEELDFYDCLLSMFSMLFYDYFLLML